MPFVLQVDPFKQGHVIFEEMPLVQSHGSGRLSVAAERAIIENPSIKPLLFDLSDSTNHDQDEDPETVRAYYEALRVPSQTPGRLPFDEFLTTRARTSTNAHSINGGNETGLFPLASMPSHSCAANSHHARGQASGTLRLCALKDIAKDEEITIDYLNAIMPTSERRKLLQVRG